ncbi:hypothetical protein AcW1_003537 [Taiwanofungus camphoratus]|nr:hypothetical protein AcW1_003537 [Antrodia cinnamomea]KAI0960768.1 hypothetical protein AcV7_000062 [Antrodia cinnamomea]
MAFEVEWTTYVRGLLKEWKLMNASCCLMLSTVVGLLQFCDNGDSEVTNAIGIISLVNVLISLAFNTLYHNTMSSLRSAQRGRLWLQGATDVAEPVWRNVPILLVVPLVWLIWSIAPLIVFVLSCVWAGPISSGSNSPLAVQDPSSELPARGGTNYPVPTLGACISITCMLIIGLMHLVVVVSEFRKLGTSRSAAMLAESGDVNEEWRDMFS